MEIIFGACTFSHKQDKCKATQATSVTYSHVKHIYRLTLDLGISIGFEGVIVSSAKFSNANGACPACVELSDAGVWALLLTANLEFPDDESPEFFLSVVSEGVFRGRVTDFKGIATAFSDEGVGGAERP